MRWVAFSIVFTASHAAAQPAATPSFTELLTQDRWALMQHTTITPQAPGAQPTSASLTIRYAHGNADTETPPRLRLDLGEIAVHAAGGELIAWHRRDRSRAFIATDRNTTIQQLLARHLPPLDVPPLRWLSDQNLRGRLEWSPEHQTFTMQRGDGEPSGLTPRWRTEFIWTELEPGDPESWSLDSASVLPVASIADLAPPPSPVATGDIFPDLAITDTLGKRWLVKTPFRLDADSAAPGRGRLEAVALVLAHSSTAEISVAAEAVRRARVAIEVRAAEIGVDPEAVTRILARAVTTAADGIDIAAPAAGLASIEFATPQVLRAPSRDSIDRFVRGAAAVLVLIDRNGIVRLATDLSRMTESDTDRVAREIERVVSELAPIAPPD